MNAGGRPRALFFGTPELAVPCLRALLDLAEVPLVITQPDRPSGRGMKLMPPPVKVVAEQAGVAVVQPTKVRTPEFAELLRAQRADVAIVIAYGRILPRAVLDAARLGSVNLHASLLPKYRGAAPIQWSIVNGDAETGVCLMQMDEGMDTGAVLASVSTPIEPNETGGDLGTRLSLLAADLLRREWSRLLRGELTPKPQDASLATIAPMLRKEDGCIHWSQSAQQIHDRVRGLSPWPGAYTFVNGQRLKLHRTRVVEAAATPAVPGEIIATDAQGLLIATGRGAIMIEEVQVEGGKRIHANQWRAGHRISAGTRFTDGVGDNP